MNKRNWVFVVCFLMVVALLSSCMGPITTPITPPTYENPTDYSLVGEPNYVPALTEDDPYPLFVGARWVYRNAATDWNPDIASSGLLESEVMAEVQANGAHCYVLRTQYSNGPDEYLYMHRTSQEVGLLGSREGAPTGALTSYSVAPGLAFLSLPLERGKEWDLNFAQGSVRAQVLFRELVAIESGTVFTLLGRYSPILLGAWRVHYTLFGAAPSLFGGPKQFVWFAPGIGIVKHVLNSVNYELAEFLTRQEVIALREGKTVGDIPEGGLVIVQLRGSSSDEITSGAWRIEEQDPATGLSLVDTAFYEDLQPVEAGGGTHVYRFRAVEPGVSVLTFVRYNRETGHTEDTVQFRVHVE